MLLVCLWPVKLQVVHTTCHESSGHLLCTSSAQIASSKFVPEPENSEVAKEHVIRMSCAMKIHEVPVVRQYVDNKSKLKENHS